MRNLTDETSFLRRYAEGSFSELLHLILVRIAALKKFTPNQKNIFFLLTIEFKRGRDQTRNVQPSNLLLKHNHIMETLANSDTIISEDYDFWANILKLKDP